jgi:hypothetical protein
MLRNKGLLYTRKKQKHRRSKKKGGERFRITSKISTGFNRKNKLNPVEGININGVVKYDASAFEDGIRYFIIQNSKKVDLGTWNGTDFNIKPKDFDLDKWYPKKIYVGDLDEMEKDKIKKNQVYPFVKDKEYFYYEKNGQVELVKCTEAKYKEKNGTPVDPPQITFDHNIDPNTTQLYEKPQHGWLNHKENEKQMIPRPLDNNQQYDLNKYDEYYLTNPKKDIKLGKFITHQFVFVKKTIDFVNTNPDLQEFSFFVLPPKIVFDKKKEPEPKLDSNKTYFQIIKNTMIPLGTYKKMSGNRVLFENKTISKNASIHEKPEKKEKLDINLVFCGLKIYTKYFWYDDDEMKYNLLDPFRFINYKFDSSDDEYIKGKLNDRLYIKPVKPVIDGTRTNLEYHGTELTMKAEYTSDKNYYYSKQDIDNDKPPVVFKLDSKLGYFRYDDTGNKLIDLGKVQYDKKDKKFYFEYDSSNKKDTVEELAMEYKTKKLFEKYNEHYLPLSNATPIVLPPVMKQHNE